ncbi:LuxR C-terminal-related transcriptional regulator [Chelatococcus sp. GCM10030263]|uniref:LuxR C-terminal-related transcriptional regulator n=1 Tax=Chelatococcus sp. GCM10030263 TaxID=3273387 RepID=UPI0036079312
MNDQPSVQIVIADDHPLYRGALQQTITTLMPGAKVIDVGTFDEAVAVLAEAGEVDLVLLDLTIPGAQRLSGLIYLRAQHPGIPVVIVSGNDDRTVIRSCMDFGAAGFIPKSLGVASIGEAIKTVLAGGTWAPPDVDLSGAVDKVVDDAAKRLARLTPQQMRVLMMLSEGLLNKQIAYELSVSEATVKAHVSAILQKLGVESRTQAVILAGRVTGTAA